MAACVPNRTVSRAFLDDLLYYDDLLYFDGERANRTKVLRC